MSQNNSFLGSGWSFPPEFSKTRVRLSTAEQDIRESLLILLSTAPGERVMQPTFGCGIKTQVFEHLNESTVAAMKDLIQRAILFFEPRVSVDRVDVRPDELEQGLVRIAIDYTVRATNSRHNIVYPYYLSEGTNVRQQG